MNYIVYFMFEGCLRHCWFSGYTKKVIKEKLKIEYPGCKDIEFEKRGF